MAVLAGSFEYEDYQASRQHLRWEYQDILDFDYYTGWRKSEVWKLEWKDVDMRAGGDTAAPGPLQEQRQPSVGALRGSQGPHRKTLAIAGVRMPVCIPCARSFPHSCVFRYTGRFC